MDVFDGQIGLSFHFQNRKILFCLIFVCFSHGVRIETKITIQTVEVEHCLGEDKCEGKKRKESERGRI